MEKETINRLIREWSGINRDDFDHDLNAMWEAERKIACENWWGYTIALNHKVCEDSDEPHNNDPETSFLMINATAAQRAEALLRTIGKWEE